MTGRLTDCLLLAFRFPSERARVILPPELEPVTHKGWAFWNVVACKVERMRPLGVPPWLGLTYCHVAYRIYARARTGAGHWLEGLYFVRSDADQRLICFVGNLLTSFRFHPAAVCLSTGDHCRAAVTANGADAWFEAEPDPQPDAPPGSCFESLDEARSFCKYQPMGLSVGRGRLHLAEVRRHEADWRETLLKVRCADFEFLRAHGEFALEIASLASPLEYRWRLGQSVPLFTE